MSNYAPFPVRSVTAAQLGYASAADHPFAPITSTGDTWQTPLVQALLDGAVSNDTVGAMTFAYWSQLIATGGLGLLIDPSTMQWVGGEQIPTFVAQWFADYSAILWLPEQIGKTIPRGTPTAADPVVGAVVPPPLPNFGVIQRVRRLIDSGTLKAWVPPAGGVAMPADLYDGQYSLSDALVLLETQANATWKAWVAYNPQTLGTLPNPPYPDLAAQLGNSVVRLSDGSIPGGLSTLAGSVDYSQVVTVDPLTGIGTVAAGTYRDITDTSSIGKEVLLSPAAGTNTPGNAGENNGGSPAVGGQATTGPGPGGGIANGGVAPNGGATTTPGAPSSSNTAKTLLWVAIIVGVLWFLTKGGR